MESTYQNLVEYQQGVNLAKQVKNGCRRPIVAVTTTNRGNHWIVDPGMLASKVGRDADVYLLEDEARAGFNDMIGEGQGVWNGAVRAYPPKRPSHYWNPMLFPDVVDRVVSFLRVDSSDAKVLEPSASPISVDDFQTARTHMMENHIRELEEENSLLRQQIGDDSQLPDVSLLVDGKAEQWDWRVDLAWLTQVPKRLKREYELPDSWGYSRAFLDQKLPDDVTPTMVAQGMLRTLLRRNADPHPALDEDGNPVATKSGAPVMSTELDNGAQLWYVYEVPEGQDEPVSLAFVSVR